MYFKNWIFALTYIYYAVDWGGDMLKTKRMRDKGPIYNLYNLLYRKRGSVLIKCSKCGGKAELTFHSEDSEEVLYCDSCGYYEKRKNRIPVVVAQGVCCDCNRWLNIPQKEGTTYPKVNVVCPYCGKKQAVFTKEIGSHPKMLMEGLELYLKGEYRNHTVWAYNYDHLNYLIEWIGAELREHHIHKTSFGNYYIWASGQSQKLPTWMKLAKNREGLLKVLKKLQKQ